ncbi:MAG: CBS domain-containing protein [Planctomycetia bacterium]|nr:CBS domain-containing protein [Planctomycetia bacterium]
MPLKDSTAVTAADVMTPDPRCCDVTSPVLEAVQIFREADCGAVPVLDAGKLFGVLSDRDVALALAEYENALRALPVGQITAPGVVSVLPGVGLSAVVNKLGDRGVRRVLVVDDAGRLLGIIGWADVAPHVSESRVGRAVSKVVEKP